MKKFFGAMLIASTALIYSGCDTASEPPADTTEETTPPADTPAETTPPADTPAEGAAPAENP